jgi:hypothetical protein
MVSKVGEVMADLGCRERFGCLMNRAWGNVDDVCDRFKRVYTFDGCFRVAERCNEAQKSVWQQRQRTSLIPEVLFDPECTTQCMFHMCSGFEGGFGSFLRDLVSVLPGLFHNFVVESIPSNCTASRLQLFLSLPLPTGQTSAHTPAAT